MPVLWPEGDGAGESGNLRELQMLDLRVATQRKLTRRRNALPRGGAFLFCWRNSWESPLSGIVIKPQLNSYAATYNKHIPIFHEGPFLHLSNGQTYHKMKVEGTFYLRRKALFLRGSSWGNERLFSEASL